jgi:hypothetical protein
MPRVVAQDILDVRATHGHDLPTTLHICAFGAALGGQRVLAAATMLASQSNIPPENRARGVSRRVTRRP